MPRSAILLADKGYDSDAIRRQVEANGTMPNIPPKANRRWKNCFSPVLYRNRNAIESAASAAYAGQRRTIVITAAQFDRQAELPQVVADDD